MAITKYSVVLVFLMTLVFVTAGSSIGQRQDGQLDVEYIISQPCASCTFINISVFTKDGIILDNVPMVNNGTTWTYNFTPTTSLRHDVNGLGDKDGTNDSFAFWFDVTLSGQQTNPSIIVSDIILLIALIGLLLMISDKHSKTDFKAVNKKIIDNHKNMGQTMVKGFLYDLFKNSFVWIYFIGWLVVLVLKDVVFRFNSSEVYGYFTLIANVYSLGLILVVVYMIGHFATYMRNTVEILTDNNWGVGE